MSRNEQDIVKIIIGILVKEKQITVNEQIRMLETLKRSNLNESAS